MSHQLQNGGRSNDRLTSLSFNLPPEGGSMRSRRLEASTFDEYKKMLTNSDQDLVRRFVKGRCDSACFEITCACTELSLLEDPTTQCEIIQGYMLVPQEQLAYLMFG